MHITHHEQDQTHRAYVVASGALLAMVLVDRNSGTVQAEAVGGDTEADCQLFAAEATAWLSSRLWRRSPLAA